ncbi:MAG TPA: VacJ family lipoprotein [Albitalea sp.]|uniref:MlaA family lipoprotein n=1 Tax=Piscinibacter sp. TaxID=1903157 RepID=UPI002ED3C3A7
MIPRRHLHAFTLLLLACLLGGCASLPEGKSLDPQDPFERFNRASFSFNDGVDRAVLKPVATTYKAVTPQVVQTGVTNFFGNLSDIPSALNALLQAKPKSAATDLARVAINSTLGLLGLVDVASPMGLERRREDFGLTLGAWGVGDGPYLVLPFLGPSSGRDAAGLVVDWPTDPLMHIDDTQWRAGLLGLRVADRRAGLLQAEKALDAAAFDRYLLVRDAYLARRASLVLDGAPTGSPLPRVPSDTP